MSKSHMRSRFGANGARRGSAGVVATYRAGTFKDVAENWFKRHVEHNKLISHGDLRRHLDRYILPKWQYVAFHDVNRRMVIELLDEISDNRGPSFADAVLSTIRSIMNWQEARDDDYRSPIASKMKRAQATTRDRVLQNDELKSVWQAADASGTFGALVKILLLTAQRREKVAKMMHSDIDQDGVWSMRSESRREKGTAQTIRLPKMAIDIINELPKFADNPFVFAGRGGKAINSYSDGKKELIAKLAQPISRWTLHDLRRTARTRMSDAGVSSDIAERVLGHAITGVQGIYDRSKYFEQKNEALQALARGV